MIPVNTEDTSAADAGPTSAKPKQDAPPRGVPSNDVYARVGDAVKLTAHEGVRRHRTAQEIIQNIVNEHRLHLNVGELRLLLAARRIPE